MALGLVVGPPLAGVVAGEACLTTVFVACAPLAVAIGLLALPRRRPLTTPGP